MVDLEQPLTRNSKEIMNAIKNFPGISTGWGNSADPFDEIY